MNMKQNLLHKYVMLCLLFAFVAFCGVQTQAAPITFNVSVANLPVGTSGFLNLQFNPGGADAQQATATVTDFSMTGGSLAPTADTMGAVAGTLPGPVIFNNTMQLNDYFQGIQFGSSFSFNVTLSGLALEAPGNTTSGTTFALLLYGADGETPIFTATGNAPPGSLLRILINPDGTTTVLNDVPSSVTVRQQAAAVPEPATMLLLGTGLAGIAATIRKQRKY